jgi:hypothetical protein
MRRIFGHGRYATVTSTLALVIALSGTAYAANTVRSIDIVDGAVQSQDIGTGAVQSVDIKNRTITAQDLLPGTLGRTPAVMARVSGSDGALLFNRGLTSVVRNTAGRYTIQAGREVANCVTLVTPETQANTATTDQASTTAINVYIDLNGTPNDSNFNVVLFC